ncbi:wiskott-Aldrich syndrome protein family member 3 isoform X2 [Tachysurus fulvidraco]|uniref:wiskott-Aldrich syndrome protein family member 3 isoform X2 n=1 Tax=Tachysurus fulvidraco TaxID=1234273 RepID=UPI001FEF4007|nr:wiskott-Aldrich syndrome protein family member 3 isoform X2 [Tachysurus fulvidraco]
MPLVKRNIKPHHVCRVAVPENIDSELQCVTNNTLSSIIHQLSSLSKHAEDVFGELFTEANTFYLRANSLQDRIDRLAVKVTQLDSNVEEASLQDVNMWKAFRSSAAEDQQVVSRISIPNPVAEMYSSCEKPPALSVLSTYREDHVDGMKFYTNPSYFFDLWKEKMLQDTEEKRKERRRQREQSVEDGTLHRENRKVRKARSRRQEWNMMALDKELRPDQGNSHSVQQGALSDSSLSPGVSCENCPNIPDHAHFLINHASSSSSEGAEHEYQSIGGTVGVADSVPTGYRLKLSTRGGVNGDIILPPVDYGLMEYYASSGPLPCPPPPPAPPSSNPGLSSSSLSCPLPPSPLPGPLLTPPPPGPPPILPAWNKESQPITDGRSDLLSAIQMGIQLKKVQEQQEQRAMRECSENDVASILSRRIAVEYSDTEDESELDVNEWSD